MLLLAVSGGVDSMALMHIVAQSVGAAKRAHILVATVDHALRASSAEEARFVQAEAERIGLEHVTLVWQGAKPTTGIQESARAARYQLLADVYHDQFFAEKALVTAHTLDDQAETVLMRLARGSGVAGLSGMSSFDLLHILRNRHGPIGVHRPFLEIPKSRLVATMRSRGYRWIEDPSNDNPAFERVRIRKAMPMLAALGITPEAIARSARRICSANHAIREATLRALQDPTLVRIDPLGYVDIDRAVWNFGNSLSEAVVLRVLAAVIRRVGGLERPLSLQSLEAVARELSLHSDQRHAGAFATTLGRTKISWLDKCVRIQREVGRNEPPPLRLVPGQQASWDNRYDVYVEADAGRSLEVRPLGAAGLEQLRQQGHAPPGEAADILHAVPSFWDGNVLVAAPTVAWAWSKLDNATAEPHITALEASARAEFQTESLTQFTRGDIEE